MHIEMGRQKGVIALVAEILPLCLHLCQSCCSPALSQVAAQEFCSTQSCPPSSQGRGFVWWPSPQCWGRLRSCCKLGAVHRAGVTQCSLGCTFTPRQWTHLHSPGSLRNKNRSMIKLWFSCWCWKYLELFGEDAFQGWESPSSICSTHKIAVTKQGIHAAFHTKIPHLSKII